ncbi:MAG: TIR domain-containing protein [Thermoanaerobaculia bacterium]
MAEFDVFLSHNSQDKAAVKALGEELKARGITVWLDEWELRPGKRWQKELEAAIASSRSVAVFVGANGLGPWEEPEMEVFLDRAMHESELPVIPVLLPGAPEKVELRPFLKLFTWVDLRDGVTPEGLERLVWGITGRKPEATNAPRAAPTPHPPALHNLPFPSLGADFKGREADLEALAQSLEGGGAAALVQAKALHGLGGVGKTRLAVEYARRFGQRYRAAFFVPVESPEALQAGLARVGQELLAELRVAGKPEEEAKQAVMAWLRKNPRWLLILDNVDSEPAQVAVRELLALDQGHVLVTSRLSGWPKGVEKLEVTVLERAAAVSLLLSATKDRRQAAEDDEAQAASWRKCWATYLLPWSSLALTSPGRKSASRLTSPPGRKTAPRCSPGTKPAKPPTPSPWPSPGAARCSSSTGPPARCSACSPTWPRSRWPWPWWTAGRSSWPSAPSGSRRRKATRPAQHPSPQPPPEKPSPSSLATRW